MRQLASVVNLALVARKWLEATRKGGWLCSRKLYLVIPKSDFNIIWKCHKIVFFPPLKNVKTILRSVER